MLSNKDARVEKTLWIDRGLGAAQRLGERVGSLAVVPGTVIAADGVVVGDRPAGSLERVGSRPLDRPPLLDLLAAARRHHHREVRRRTVLVCVGEAAGDETGPADRLARRADDGLVERREALP